jgi:hypothetical protein
VVKIVYSHSYTSGTGVIICFIFYCKVKEVEIPLLLVEKNNRRLHCAKKKDIMGSLTRGVGGGGGFLFSVFRK